MNTNAHRQPSQARTPNHVEWPTVFLIAVTWLSFALLTFFYQQIPLWLIIPLAAYTLTLFGSLQHEVLHGHPTPWQWLNEALIFPAMTLWIPYSLYKQTHLKHHNNDDLTDPDRDPESYYISADQWETLPNWKQRYYQFYNSFVGRFFWGPVHIMAQLLISESRQLLSGCQHTFKRWLVHAAACALLLYWVIAVCGISFWEYFLVFVYPGLALSLVRSFAEHQLAADPKHRSVIVEACPLLSLAFLNNNLHAVHHAHPGLAWYKIPAIWKTEREQILADNNGYYFSGYREIACRYWLNAKESPRYSAASKPA